MTDMPGNPYAEEFITSLHTAASLQDSQSLDLEKIEHALIAVAEATAAQAYEQRTANMIASREFIAVTDHEIEQRLGRHDDQ